MREDPQITPPDFFERAKIDISNELNNKHYQKSENWPRTADGKKDRGWKTQG